MPKRKEDPKQTALQQTPKPATPVQDSDRAQTIAQMEERLCRLTHVVTKHLAYQIVSQLEAMAKLKGKTGQQKVVVEHVHVHSGGQAIVGAVTTPGKPDRGEGGNRGH